MYNNNNGNAYLSCIKVPTAKQDITKNVQKLEKPGSMDFTTDRRDLISAANKVFGENKWNHTVVSQTLDYIDTTDAADKMNVGDVWRVGCVSFVKVQLENGNFHEDIGYYIAEEHTKGLSLHNARIGSAVNALKRVLLSFGDKIESELQKQINPDQANNIQTNVAQSLNKQVFKRSDVIGNRRLSEQYPIKIKVSDVMDDNEFVSIKTKISDVMDDNEFVFCTSPMKQSNKSKRNKNSDVSTTDPIPVSTMKVSTTDDNPLSSVKIQGAKSVEPSLDKTNSTSEQKSNSALSKQEILRIERKRKQIEKQMEFKRKMMEKEGSIGDNKPNPRY